MAEKKNFYVGQKARSEKKYSSEMLFDYAQLSGDHNPLHLDEKYASQTQFGSRIVHGTFLMGQISALLANHLPGPGSIYLKQNIQFKNPAYIDESIICEIEILELNHKNRFLLSTVLKKVTGEIVAIGEAKILYSHGLSNN